MRVDDLEEIRHQLRDAHDRRVEPGPYTFGITVVLTVERLPDAVRSSSLGEEDPRQRRDEGLNAPQTAARQIDFLGLAHVPMLRLVVDRRRCRTRRRGMHKCHGGMGTDWSPHAPDT